MKQNTKVLEEAYKKIITDKELQNKFLEAIIEKKLEEFLEEQKIEATVEDVKAYLTEKYASKDVELSKEELDMAAGGVDWLLVSYFSPEVRCGFEWFEPTEDVSRSF